MCSRKSSSILLFLLGLGSATKIFFFGTIAISELVIFFIAPIIFMCKYYRMRREGFMSFVYMLGLMVGGMFLSAKVNHSPFTYTFKQFAIFYGFFAYYIVFYSLLRNNLKGIGWFYLGSAISGIITIWAFNPTADVSSSGFEYIAQADTEQLMAGPLFWIGKIRGWGQLPIIMAYLKTPLLYSALTPFMFVVFALVTSISGRAQSICVLLGAAMIIIGRKSRKSMRGIGRHFFLLLLLGFIMIMGYKIVYSYAASNGYLGEAARGKYAAQTERGSGLISILMSGRKEFFIALSAIVDHPIVGFGPRAPDTNGYAEKFIQKHGTYDEIVFYRYYLQHYNIAGVVPSIPTHSHIMAAWIWCGIAGFIFFVWLLWQMYKHIRFYSAAIPQWYGYYALTIPSMLWSVFFNPFGSRWWLPLLVVCMFFSRAVALGRIVLPYELEAEARKYD